MGSRIKGKRIAPGLIIGLMLAILTGFTAWGDAVSPDAMQFKSVQVSGNLTESGDIGFFFHYNIEYEDPPGHPDELVDELFTFRLISTDNTSELGAVSPYAVPNSGYGEGCTAFYFAPEDAPAWGQAYTIRIAGNPNMFSNPPILNYTVSLADYTTSDNRTLAREFLTNYIISVTRLLEDAWDIDLLDHTDTGTVLNSVGESYFRASIPGIQVMAPDLFYIQSISPDYDYREWGSGLADNYTGRFDGTMVGDWLSGIEADIGVDWSLATSGITVLIMVGWMVISQKAFATTEPGLIAAAITFLGSAVIGFVHVAVMAIVAILFALFIGYVLFFRTS